MYFVYSQIASLPYCTDIEVLVHDEDIGIFVFLKRSFAVEYSHDACRSFRSHAQCIPLGDALRMASETPARIMGVFDRKGSLQKDKDADILIMDKNLNIRAVWQGGNLALDKIHS